MGYCIIGFVLSVVFVGEIVWAAITDYNKDADSKSKKWRRKILLAHLFIAAIATITMIAISLKAT